VKNITQLEKHLSPEHLELIHQAGVLAAERGLRLYLVGGAVRDLLLGRATYDIDLVLEGDAPELAGLLARRIGGQITTHRRFRTAKFRRGNLSIDLATARSETYSHPGALPTVEPSSIENDLARRDFTINAIAVQVNLDGFGRLIDPFEGRKDLTRKLVRVLHDRSFIDDATRMLRAIRYEQRFDFRLEATTDKLLRRDLSTLQAISGDRIRHELELILKEEIPERPLGRAEELDMLGTIHPSLKWDSWTTKMFQQARSKADSPSLGLYLSLLVYRRGRQEAEDFIVRLRFPKATANVVRDTLRLKENLKYLEAPDLSPSVIYGFLRDYLSTSILACAIASDSPLVYDRLNLYLSKLRFVRTSLNGTALQEMGFPSGPRTGEILRALLEAKLDQKIGTREEETRLARFWLSQGGRHTPSAHHKG